MLTFNFSSLQWTWVDCCSRLCWSSGPELALTPWTRKRMRWTTVRRWSTVHPLPNHYETKSTKSLQWCSGNFNECIHCFIVFLSIWTLASFSSSYSRIVFLCPQWTESRRTGSRKEMDISKCHHTRQSSLGKQEAELYSGNVSLTNPSTQVKCKLRKLQWAL